MKRRHTILSVLIGTWIVSFMDRMAISVAIPYISADFRLDPFQSGVVMTIFFAGYALTQVPGGMLADRFGVRKVATAAMLWWSVMTAVTGGVASYTQMLATRFLFGVGEGIFPACAFKTIAVWFPKRERATANSFMLASNPLGAALSPLIVVAIMSLWGWRAVFHGLALLGVVMAVVFWRLVTDRPVDPQAEGHDSPDAAPVGSEHAGSLRSMLLDPTMLKYFAVSLLVGMANWGFATWLPTYLVKVRGFSMVQMGVAASLPFFAGAIGAVAGGWVSDKFFSDNRRVPVVAGQFATALLIYLMVTTKSSAMLIAYQTLVGGLMLFLLSAFWAFPMNTVPASLMGRCGGLINMAAQIAAFISPMLFGFLVKASGGRYEWSFASLAGSLLVACVIMLTLPKSLKSEESALSSGPSKKGAVAN